MRSLLTAYVRGKKRTLKYEFAVLQLGMLLFYEVRILISSDPAWILAQQGVLGVMIVPSLAFVAAAVGLQSWENRQFGDVPGGTVITSQIDDGEQVPAPSPESSARSVV
jgi:hypothetical protein